MTGGSIRECGTVLAEVKAKPSGWPTASPDLGSGRYNLAAIETPAPHNQDQISAKRKSLRFEGIAT